MNKMKTPAAREEAAGAKICDCVSDLSLNPNRTTAQHKLARTRLLRWRVDDFLTVDRVEVAHG